MKYFGTDGIRGFIKDLNSDFCYKIGRGIASYILKNNLTNNVIIGKDTRISGDMVISSISAALLDYNINVEYIGIVPTGCVSYLSKTKDNGLSIMITASHNEWNMNGIKIFNNNGFKLSNREESILEDCIDSPLINKSIEKGKFIDCKQYVLEYKNHILLNFNLNLSNLSIAIDCANGSNYELGIDVYKQLKANVIPISNSDNGKLINKNCGAQYIENLQKEVLAHGCDYGFAFDGDADRLRVVLKNGEIIDGDDLLVLFAYGLKKLEKLNKSVVVGTIMTNSGVDEFLSKYDIKVEKVSVGDKNVIELMNNENYSLGGEPSGHMCLLDVNTSCDALANSLFFLKIIQECNVDIYSFLSNFKKKIQTSKNIELSDVLIKKYDEIAIKNYVNELIKENKDVRIIVRKSGTEPVIRIMVESDYEELNVEIIDKIVYFMN